MDKYTKIKLLEAFELVEAQRKYAVSLLQARLTDLMSKSEQAPLFSMIELMDAFKAGMEYQRKQTQKERDREYLLNMKITDLPFTVRTINCLRECEINSVRDLTEKTERELRTIKMGKKSFDEIMHFLEVNNFTIKKK